MSSVYIPLPNRSVIKISGADKASFLQGIITNDINKVSPDNTIYACLLTPQGKYLADFFVAQMGDDFVIDCDKSQREFLIKRLSMYKLRSDVKIEDISTHYEVTAMFGPKVFEQENMGKKAGKTIKFCKGIAYIDPRTPDMYARAIIEKENNYKSFEAKDFAQGKYDEYEKLRISLTIPETNKELISDKSFPLMNRMEEMNAIDFNKGCYVGQEVTARSKHRGNLRKTLFTVEIDGNEQNSGNVTSSIGNLAIVFKEKI